MEIEERVIQLDKRTKQKVKNTLKSINLALKLKSAQMKAGKIPKKLQHLIFWKNELEAWQQSYGSARDLMAMAEGIGAFNEICARMG
jgi:hypothetical protein